MIFFIMELKGKYTFPIDKKCARCYQNCLKTNMGKSTVTRFGGVLERKMGDAAF